MNYSKRLFTLLAGEMSERKYRAYLIASVVFLFQCLLFLYPLSVFADNQVSHIPFQSAPAGSVGLGAGFRFGASPYKFVETLSSIENDSNSDLVPLYLYEGEYVFSHGTRGGLHLWRKHVQVDALVQYRFDRLETEVSDYYAGINDRSQTMEGGLSVSASSVFGVASVSFLHDLQNRYGGYEMDFTYRYTWETGRWSVSPFVSVVYQSNALVQYYYGVSEAEVDAGADFSVYQPDDALFSRFGVNTSYRLFENWMLFANISFEKLASSVEESPLVDEEAIYNAYLGFSYRFGNVFQSDSVFDLNEIEDWSWRLHSGYTVDAIFYQIHVGDVQRSRDAHTYLVGGTLGKLLSNGKKIDFWGKVSVNRRLENGYQDNFWEYNAYVMAMGAGYSPWSSKEVFRYGFGFGFSYAQKISIEEQKKQGNSDANTSRFLNYLEAQLDLPLRNFFDHKSVKDCYAGLTIIHRSGIFGRADILGNVAGGSDVLAGHLECKR